MVVVKLTMSYGAKSWLIKNFHVQKIRVRKMMILRWMCRHKVEIRL